MNRATFLARLRDGLRGLPPSAINDIISDYETHFADGTAAGRSEDDVAAALGDPSRLARELRTEAGIQRWEAEPSAGNFLGVVIALLGLATIDIMFIFPFLFAAAGIFFGFAVLCVVGCAGGVYLLLSLLPLGVGFPEMGSVMLRALAGVGLVTGSIGSAALLALVVIFSAKLLVKFARLHYRLLDSANKSV